MSERKTALITGATSGIGKAFAKRFASLGYDLIITGRRADVIAAVADEIRRVYGVQARVVIAELASEEGMQKRLIKLIADIIPKRLYYRIVGAAYRKYTG